MESLEINANHFIKSHWICFCVYLFFIWKTTFSNSLKIMKKSLIIEYNDNSLRWRSVSFFPEWWKELHSLARKAQTLRSSMWFLMVLGCHGFPIKINLEGWTFRWKANDMRGSLWHSNPYTQKLLGQIKYICTNNKLKKMISK